MTTRFFSVLAAALSLSLSAGFVAPTHAAPVSVGVRQLAQAPRQNKLNLSDDQKAKIKQIQDDAQQQITNSVLNDSQRQQLQAASSGGTGNRQQRRDVWRSLNLSQDQQTQIRQIRKQAEQNIYNNVLTADQQQQVQQMRQQRSQRQQQQQPQQ